MAAWYISHRTVEQQVELLKKSFMNDSYAQMWQMYVGIVGVNCDAWVQFTIECNLTLNGFKDPLSYLYYFQCLLEGGRKGLDLTSSVFRNSTIRIPLKTLLSYHVVLLCLFLSKSTEQWKHYNFHGNAIGDVGVKLLTNFLLINKRILTCIKVLNLSSNCLTSQSATAISIIIQEGSLVTLDLSCNGLGESGTTNMSLALKVNTSLKTLFLSFNDIGVSGAKSLSTALRHNHILEHVIISYNKIMDDGVKAISECFKMSVWKNVNLSCIKSLNLAANCLTSHSKTAISTIIQEGALISLDLSYNKLGESGAYEISRVLQADLMLKHLFLSNNMIGVQGALAIAVALCHNHSLKHLDISNNGILDDGAMSIAECLRTNRTLKSLKVSDNNITEIGAAEIINVLKFNHTFEILMVDKKCAEMLKSYNEQLLYNETVEKYYHIEDLSDLSDHGHEHNQSIKLIRIWNRKLI